LAAYILICKNIIPILRQKQQLEQNDLKSFYWNPSAENYINRI